MKKGSVLYNQSVNRKKRLFPFKRTLGQLGFGLIKVFLLVLWFGGLSVILISGYRFLSSAPYLRLHNIVVTGVNDDLREEVIKISGLKGGENLLSIHPATVKRNIEAHPWIKSVSLKKQFPHTLYIKAEQEEPVAIVLLGRMYYMDGEGAIFKWVEGDDVIDFPVVTGLAAGDKRSGAYLKRAASFLDALCSVDGPSSLKGLSEIHVGEDGILTIYFNKLPFRVSFGKDDFIKKIDSLTGVIEHLLATRRLYQVRSIDLDYSDRAVVAFAGR